VEISGGFTLEVDAADLETFVNDPQVKEALTATVAEISGAAVEDVELNVSIATRRLQSPLPDRRRLAAASVVVSYVVTVPQDDGSSTSATGSSTSVLKALTNMNSASVSSVLTPNLEARVGAGTYTVVVQSVAAVVTKVIRQITTTPSAGTSAAPVSPVTVESSNVGVIVAVILCILGAVACIVGMVLLGVRRSRQKGESPLLAGNANVEVYGPIAIVAVPEPPLQDEEVALEI